jgi:hypothetical protein
MVLVHGSSADGSGFSGILIAMSYAIGVMVALKTLGPRRLLILLLLVGWMGIAIAFKTLGVITSRR